MTYTSEVVNKFMQFQRQDARLGQIVKKSSMSQRQADAIIYNMQLLTNIRVKLENYLALSGDLGQYIINIENGLAELKDKLDVNAQKMIQPSFIQRLFGSPDIDKLKSKGDVRKLLELMISNKGAISKQAFEALVQLGTPTISKLLDSAQGILRKRNELIAVALVLKEMGEPAIKPLISLLKQNNYTRTETAMIALGIINDNRAGEPFLKIIGDNKLEYWFSRIIAVTYIGRLLGPRAQDPLIKLINEGDVITLHKGTTSIVNALGEIGDQKAVNALKKMMKKNSSYLTSEVDITGCINMALVNIQNRLNKKQPVSSSSSKETSGIYYGGLGESYCSKECLDKGGKYIASVMLKEQAGVCGFCQKEVKASMYGSSGCGVIPYEGINLFVCSNCGDKAKEYLGSYQKCCMCQSEITH